MKKGALVIAWIVISIRASSQDIDSMACKIIDIFKKKDTASIAGIFFMPDDTPFVIGKKMEAEGIENTPSTTSNTGADTAVISFKQKLKDAFLELYKKPVESGRLDWGKVKCNNYSFAVQMNPSDGLPVAHGQIIIGTGNNIFEIVLKSMMKVNGRWKILDIDIVQK